MKKTPMRDGYTRAREIEREAQALVAWVDTFVADVRDNLGHSLKQSGEWDEVVEDLRQALRPIDPPDWQKKLLRQPEPDYDETVEEEADRLTDCLP